MRARLSRREFAAILGGGAAASVFPSRLFASNLFPSGTTGTFALPAALPELHSRFKLSIMTDEISQDFGHALQVAAKEFGFGYVEVRTLWNKNVINLDAKEMSEAQRLLKQYDLKVTDIASPLFKTDWPGAPKSKYSPDKPQFGADYSFAEQAGVMERSIAAAQALGTTRVRCFDFWRLEDPRPARAAIDEHLRKAAAQAAAKGITLLLENEFACNTATGAEAAHTLQAVTSPNLLLNWDPGNAAYRGEIAFPDGFQKLPKDRIGHVHCKDVVKKSGEAGVERKSDGAAVPPKGDQTYDWAAMGTGIIDFVGQFRALVQAGYRGTMSLETHWHGAGSPEESSRQSWAGMKKQLTAAGALP